MKSHVDLEPIRLLSDSVKTLMNDFKRLEEPFLNEPPEEKEKDVERSEVSGSKFCSRNHGKKIHKLDERSRRGKQSTHTRHHHLLSNI